jgi:hypothetical protein
MREHHVGDRTSFSWPGRRICCPLFYGTLLFPGPQSWLPVAL